jgi:hypothetical protein
MSSSDQTVRRTLQFKFTMPGADPEQVAAMVRSAGKFYGMFGSMRMRLLQNVDDPAKFVQEIEYDASEAVEINRQKIAGDPAMQAYLQAWRTMFPGAVEIDVYREL